MGGKIYWLFMGIEGGFWHIWVWGDVNRRWGEVRSKVCGSEERCSRIEKWINWKRKLTMGLHLVLNEEWVELGLSWGRGLVWVTELSNRTTVRERIGVSEVLSLSLSLSLSHVWDPKMVCSENRNVNQFPGQSHKTHNQLKCFSRKFYFPCETKHAVKCKIISWNGFTQKQTQP